MSNTEHAFHCATKFGPGKCDCNAGSSLLEEYKYQKAVVEIEKSIGMLQKAKRQVLDDGNLDAGRETLTRTILQVGFALGEVEKAS